MEQPDIPSIGFVFCPQSPYDAAIVNILIHSEVLANDTLIKPGVSDDNRTTAFGFLINVFQDKMVFQLTSYNTTTNTFRLRAIKHKIKEYFSEVKTYDGVPAFYVKSAITEGPKEFRIQDHNLMFQLSWGGREKMLHIIKNRNMYVINLETGALDKSKFVAPEIDCPGRSILIYVHDRYYNPLQQEDVFDMKQRKKKKRRKKDTDKHPERHKQLRIEDVREHVIRKSITEEILRPSEILDQQTMSNNLYTENEDELTDLFKKGGRHILIAPTGSGKTRIGMLHAVQAMLDNIEVTKREKSGIEAGNRHLVLIACPYRIIAANFFQRLTRLRTIRPCLGKLLISDNKEGNSMTLYTKKKINVIYSGTDASTYSTYFSDLFLSEKDVIGEGGVIFKTKALPTKMYCDFIVGTYEMVCMFLNDVKTMQQIKDEGIVIHSVYDELQESLKSGSSRFVVASNLLDKMVTESHSFLGLTGSYSLVNSRENKIDNIFITKGYKDNLVKKGHPEEDVDERYPENQLFVITVAISSPKIVHTSTRYSISRFAKGTPVDETKLPLIAFCRKLHTEFGADVVSYGEIVDKIKTHYPELIHMADSVCHPDKGCTIVILNNKADVITIMRAIVLTIYAIQQAIIDEVAPTLEKKKNEGFYSVVQTYMDSFGWTEHRAIDYAIECGFERYKYDASNDENLNRWALPIYPKEIFYKDREPRVLTNEDGGFLIDAVYDGVGIFEKKREILNKIRNAVSKEEKKKLFQKLRNVNSEIYRYKGRFILDSPMAFNTIKFGIKKQLSIEGSEFLISKEKCAYIYTSDYLEILQNPGEFIKPTEYRVSTNQDVRNLLTQSVVFVNNADINYTGLLEDELMKVRKSPRMWIATQRIGVGADFSNIRRVIQLNNENISVTDELTDQMLGRCDRERRGRYMMKEQFENMKRTSVEKFLSVNEPKKFIRYLVTNDFGETGPIRKHVNKLLSTFGTDAYRRKFLTAGPIRIDSKHEVYLNEVVNTYNPEDRTINVSYKKLRLPMDRTTRMFKNVVYRVFGDVMYGELAKENSNARKHERIKIFLEKMAKTKDYQSMPEGADVLFFGYGDDDNNDVILNNSILINALVYNSDEGKSFMKDGLLHIPGGDLFDKEILPPFYIDSEYKKRAESINYVPLIDTLVNKSVAIQYNCNILVLKNYQSFIDSLVCLRVFDRIMIYAALHSLLEGRTDFDSTTSSGYSYTSFSRYLIELCTNTDIKDAAYDDTLNRKDIIKFKEEVVMQRNIDNDIPWGVYTTTAVFIKNPVPILSKGNVYSVAGGVENIKNIASTNSNISLLGNAIKSRTFIDMKITIANQNLKDNSEDGKIHNLFRSIATTSKLFKRPSTDSFTVDELVRNGYFSFAVLGSLAVSINDEIKPLRKNIILWPDRIKEMETWFQDDRISKENLKGCYYNRLCFDIGKNEEEGIPEEWKNRGYKDETIENVQDAETDKAIHTDDKI
jgi:hypothetical protein